MSVISPALSGPVERRELTVPSDYARIERAIHFIDAHATQQPTLDEVAASTGLSPFHFQRLFTRWAGISPKRFLQYLTLEHAKVLLAERRSLLETSLAVGLSGTSRLHELFVAITAMTPGEYKQGGSGLRIRYGVHPSPFGEALLAVCDRGLCALSFLKDGKAAAVSELRANWPAAVFEWAPSITAAFAARAFPPRRFAQREPLALVVRGTGFQVKIWEALLRIPPGHVATYQDVARAAGAETAWRAAASAIGENPIAFLIPCHRVIRNTGAFGEYRWGATRKRAMLAWESAHVRGEAGPSAIEARIWF
jgi:AraC family transcriptional regulator, regulatory protein of adaptative response / methylated-DNA-[protein]-cysteine methyltransferase